MIIRGSVHCDEESLETTCGLWHHELTKWLTNWQMEKQLNLNLNPTSSLTFVVHDREFFFFFFYCIITLTSILKKENYTCGEVSVTTVILWNIIKKNFFAHCKHTHSLKFSFANTGINYIWEKIKNKTIIMIFNNNNNDIYNTIITLIKFRVFFCSNAQRTF